jgi:ribosomal protein S18 acetylase RimI-like enzyme
MTPSINITSSTGTSLIPQTASLYATAFHSDPAITYVLGTLSQSQRHAYLEEYFTRIATAAALNDATFHEADSFSSIAIVLPPGKTVDNPWTLIPAGILSVLGNFGFTGCWRMLGEYEPATKRVRKTALGSQGKQFYYLFFIATREDARGKGLSSALIERVQGRAREERLPVWLEATTTYSRGIYARLGFETVGTVVLGKGSTGADGMEQEGGVGVPIYCMVWWPGK